MPELSIRNKIVPATELSVFGGSENLNQLAGALVQHQKQTWELAKTNYESLHQVRNRIFDFGHFQITTQFNPGRYRSSAAKTDAKSIAERPCFLCLENLPAEQKGILFMEKYLILTNPFPIFREHLTITSVKHIPQLIYPHLEDMLELSQELSEFTVFYNGPKTGASAPDHFHFQAGTRNTMPADQELESLLQHHSETLLTLNQTKLLAVKDYLRPFIAVVSGHKKEIRKIFNLVYGLVHPEQDEEPMMNILCSYAGNEWRLMLFLREKQRPSHFYRNENPIVVGPASVECGGLLILPREEDFQAINAVDIAEIYGEVAIKPEDFYKLTQALKNQQN